MPATKIPKLSIHLDLLHPQSNPEKITSRLLRWLLSSGRYIFIFVEGLVLIAFLSRFKLDGDLAEKKDTIEQLVPYIQSLKQYEIAARDLQLKLSSINSLVSQQPDYSQILKTVASKTPTGVKISSLNLTKDISKSKVQINAQAQNNNDLVTFVSALKQALNFSDVNLISISLEQNIISFSITLNANSQIGEKL